MIASAELDSLTVSFPVSNETMEEIFGRDHESWKHDFKLRYNSSDQSDKLEITKDIVAFANTAGGYIVIGLRDNGELVGLSEPEIEAIDEAVIRAQVQSYLGTAVDLFVSSVTREGKRCVLIAVLRSLRSPLVFEKDGTYNLPSGQTKYVFREGDVFVRHGSACEKWNQSDVGEMYARVVEREKDRWLREVVPDLRRLVPLLTPTIGTAPTTASAASALLGESPEDFERAIADLEGR